MLNAVKNIVKTTAKTFVAVSAKECNKKKAVVLNKLETKFTDAGHRIGLNHFQDYLFLKVKARNEEISTTWLGNPDIIKSMLEGKSRSEREVIYRKLYRNNLVKFNNEESKLSFCGVYDVCDIWLETVK